MLKKKQENKGITLVALVVTIVILLILAGISISAITGNNGIINQAIKAKELTKVSNEKEAIETVVLLAKMQKNLDFSNKYYIGTSLYDRTQENGAIWNIIVINDTQKVYGTGWNYIPSGTNIQDYGETKYAWS